MVIRKLRQLKKASPVSASSTGMQLGVNGVQLRSRRTRRASCKSFGMIVVRLVWIASRFVSSAKSTKYASIDIWKVITAIRENRRSVLKSCAISRISRSNGNFGIQRRVDFCCLHNAEQGAEMRTMLELCGATAEVKTARTSERDVNTKLSVAWLLRKPVTI